MRRLVLDRHALPALLAAAVALVVAFGGGSGGAAVGTAASYTPRAADAAGPGPDARFPVGGPSLEAAQRIAHAHWGGVPCAGTVEIRWAQLDGDTNATASWRNPTDAWNNPAENFDCTVELNSGMEYDWPKLCTVVAHELGHLLGRRHADDPRDLMAPVYSGELPACASAADPAAVPAPPPAPAAAQRVAEPRTAAAAKPRPSKARRAAGKRRKRGRSAGRRAGRARTQGPSSRR